MYIIERDDEVMLQETVHVNSTLQGAVNPTPLTPLEYVRSVLVSSSKSLPVPVSAIRMQIAPS
jgi:hypothetical protein